MLYSWFIEKLNNIKHAEWIVRKENPNWYFNYGYVWKLISLEKKSEEK